MHYIFVCIYSVCLHKIKTELLILWTMDEDLKKPNPHNGSVSGALDAKKPDQPKAAALQKNVSMRERESYSLWAHIRMGRMLHGHWFLSRHGTYGCVKGLTVGQPGGAWHHHCSVIPPLPDPSVCIFFCDSH